MCFITLFLGNSIRRRRNPFPATQTKPNSTSNQLNRCTFTDRKTETLNLTNSHLTITGSRRQQIDVVCLPSYEKAEVCTLES